MNQISLNINGKPVSGSVEPRTHLADFLREGRDLTGTHLGCEHGVCGACTILVDDMPVRSCITYAVACDGAEVVTIEGLDDDEITRELREAFKREHALQCGLLHAGHAGLGARISWSAALTPTSTTSASREPAICGRCTGYVGIIKAIRSVIAARRGRDIAAARAAAAVCGSRRSGHASAEPDQCTGSPHGTGSGVATSTSWEIQTANRSGLDPGSLVRPEVRRELSVPAGVEMSAPAFGTWQRVAGDQPDRRADARTCRGTDPRQGRADCRRVSRAAEIERDESSYSGKITR